MLKTVKSFPVNSDDLSLVQRLFWLTLHSPSAFYLLVAAYLNR